ncbi:MAG: FAD-binding oxidoreductase [Patescibacteria group bacterium]
MPKSSLTVVDADVKKKKQSAPTKKVAKKVAKKASAKKSVKKSVSKKASAKVKQPKVTTTNKNHPLGHLLVEKILREAGFRGGISSNKDVLEKYATDESIFSIKPQVIIQPKDAADVEAAVRVIAEKTAEFPSLSLTPRAAGTGLSGGSLTDSIVIDVCAHMKAIGPVTKKKGVHLFTCEPGAMWRDVERKLKEKDVYLPPFPASKDICSVGGSVANNAAGPDSLRYGHCADWVESVEVVLRDGNTYTIEPLTYKQLKTVMKKKNALGEIVTEIFALIDKNEKTIDAAKPKTKKNSAGYPLWDVLRDVSVAQFKKGKGHFDLTRLISGSQGTIGIITNITLRAEPIQHNTELIVVPVFDLADASDVVVKALTYNPINVEVFDALTFDLALKNPTFFKDRLKGMDYYRVLLSMYTTFHVRYGRKVPEFTLLVTIDKDDLKKHSMTEVVKDLSRKKVKARHVKNEIEREMFWQIRRASYSLSKFQDPTKRPAAFLEDMTVPPENLSKFFVQVKKLLKEFNVTAAVHGHGGNGHFHFYPLLDFTKDTTPKLVEKMAEEFFNTAVKYKGNICGEHNDGIIRTPHLSKMFSKEALQLFVDAEHIFDPDDIFNPGKKVNPRFDIKETLRKTN